MNTKLYNKNFGLLYSLGAAIFSWVFYFFLKGNMVSSAKVVIFFPDEIKVDLFTSSLIVVAVIFELIGFGIKIRRIRHIKTKPEEYSEFYKPSVRSYESDLIIFHFISIFGSRLILSALMGYISFALFGLIDWAWAGSILFITKDLIFLPMGMNKSVKALRKKPSKAANLISNILLVFSGFVYISIGFEAFGSRFREVICTISNWQGLGDFILGIILMIFFYFLLAYPTRVAYQMEEIEFTDNKKEERKLMLYYLYATLFAVIPWML